MTTFQQLLLQKKYDELRRWAETQHPYDLAEQLDDLTGAEALALFRVLPKDLSAEVFASLSSERKQEIAENSTDPEVRELVKELDLDDTVDFIEEMPANIVNRVLALTPSERRDQINTFLNYPEDSAGSVMSVEFVVVRKRMSVGEAIEKFRDNPYGDDCGSTIFVTDEQWHLEGAVNLKHLVLAAPSERVEQVMETNVVATATHTDREEVVETFRRYDLTALPVTDTENRLVGVITVDDVLDVMVSEQTEDIHKMAAIDPSEKDYMKEGIWALSKHRIVWLLVLMISATFTGNIIQHYEEVLESMVMLAMFIPMLMDTGGNAGSQSATLIIRGLALKQISIKDLFRVMWKEFRVGIVCGLLLVLANGLRLYFFVHPDLKIITVVSASLLFTVIFSKVVGSILPIIAKAIKMDPAIMAGPLITTIVDACTLLIYFGVATFIMGTALG